MPDPSWPPISPGIHYVKTTITVIDAATVQIDTRLWWWVDDVKVVRDYTTTYDGTPEDLTDELALTGQQIDIDYIADHA